MSMKKSWISILLHWQECVFLFNSSNSDKKLNLRQTLDTEFQQNILLFWQLNTKYNYIQRKIKFLTSHSGRACLNRLKFGFGAIYMNKKHTSLCISLFWNLIQWIVPYLTSFKQKFSSVHFCLWNYAVSWNKKKQIMQFTVIKKSEWHFFAYTYITFIATWICLCHGWNKT